MPEGMLLIFYEGEGQLSATHFNSVQPFTALLYFELNLVVVANFVNEAGYVYKNVFASCGVVDETKTFGLIEEFYGSCLHDARR